ncbi:MAG: hypothetical protein WC353_03055 [Candidatus Peribacter sp.]
MKYPIKPQSFIIPAIGGGVGWYLSNNVSVGVAVFSILLMPVWVKIYIAYAKDNPQKLWFKRKLYGWGWVPVSWQGWLVTFGYVGIAMALALTIDDNSPTREVAFMFVLPFAILTAMFIRLAYKKGEKPRWQWGDDGK